MMIRSGIVFLLCLASVLGKGYENFKIYDVIATNQKQGNVLFELSKQDDYDFFILPRILNQTSRVMVPPQKQREFLRILGKNRMDYNLLNANVGKTIEAEFAANRKPRTWNSRKLGTERYHSHDDINNYLDVLAEEYPSRVFVKKVGKTYENRTMKTITITNGDGKANKKIIFVDGGMHAREWISPAAVVYVIEQLVENYEENKELLADYNWVIMPVVNADGYEYTQQSTSNRFWRKTRTPYKGSLNRNCHGADPNRNFDFHWMEEGASSSPCSETYAGPSGFSEPETRVVRDVLTSIQDRCKFYLTIHSYGQYLLYPWGWSSDLPETWKDLDEVAMAGYNAILKETGTIYTVGSSTNVLYVAAGASDDYAFGVNNIPISITMELPGGGTMGFDPPVSSIDGFVKETWVGIKAMGLKVIEKY
ncbi:carboxypeptidase B-like [Episyrphus balteatus]|uniref:carboxypeptidase B-like n=1 Tax=Episyrphus balteatus TaxID=286459 RepID=UPI00248639F1|nr:carboxypeptidase B-like [Episyrphus balteatus]